MLRFQRKFPPSAISFSSINKPDSAPSVGAWIYVEWLEGFKMAPAVPFVFPVKRFAQVPARSILSQLLKCQVKLFDFLQK